MPQPLPPSLSAIRRSVLVRSGLSTVNDINARHRELVDEFIRSAQRHLYLKCEWTRRLGRSTFAAVQGQMDYDIPSYTSVGGIIRIATQDTNDIETDLLYDDLSDLERYRTMDPTQPRFWRVIDDVIRILPVVDAANFPTFVMEFQYAESPLVNDTDYPGIDGEAIIRMATISMKEHLGTFKDLAPAKQDFIDYLHSLRQDVNPTRMYGMASRDWQGPVYMQLQTTATGIGTGPFSVGWNPWPG